MQNEKPFYLIKTFEKFSITAAFTKRSINVGPPLSSNKFHIQNRKLFLNSLGIDYKNLVYPQQIHKAGIVIVKAKDKGRVIFKKDAIITKERKAALAIFSADCLPIFIYDPVAGVIALIHAGWQGTKLGIAKHTVNKMQELFKTKPKNIISFFGPHIKECCCEVGKEFNNYFKEGLINKRNKIFLDLGLVNKNQLINIGVKNGNINDINICTSCQNEHYFSYRKEGASCGRMMSVMMIR